MAIICSHCGEKIESQADFSLVMSRWKPPAPQHSSCSMGQGAKVLGPEQMKAPIMFAVFYVMIFGLPIVPLADRAYYGFQEQLFFMVALLSLATLYYLWVLLKLLKLKKQVAALPE